MIKLANVFVYNIPQALKGMRNPLESWSKSDSCYRTLDPNYTDYMKDEYDNLPVGSENSIFEVGHNDRDLALQLVHAGTDHSKFLRQILVSMDITAPLYFYKEFDTYKVGTVSNSTSTMHTLHKTPISEELFSVDKADSEFEYFMGHLEGLRLKYLATGDKEIWRHLIQMLPSSFNQTRTWTANYQVLRNMYHSRKSHKLQEWREFCESIEELPCSELIITKGE